MIDFTHFRTLFLQMLDDITKVVLNTSHLTTLTKFKKVLENDELLRQVHVKWSKVPKQRVQDAVNASPRQLNQLETLLPLVSGYSLSGLYQHLTKENQDVFFDYILFMVEAKQHKLLGPAAPRPSEEDLEPFNVNDLSKTMQDIQESPMFSNIMQQAQNMLTKNQQRV